MSLQGQKTTTTSMNWDDFKSMTTVNINWEDIAAMTVAAINWNIFSDGGVNWNIVGGNGRWRDIHYKPENTNVLYATKQTSGTSNVYRSLDGGATWQTCANGISNSNKRRPLIAITPINSEVVYALFSDNAWGYHGLYKSTDGGKTFDITIRVPHGDNHDLWIDPNNPMRMVNANDGGGCVSVNGGDEIIEMSRMGKLIAKHMVDSVQTSAHVQSFIEIDVTNIVKWRDKVKDAFFKRKPPKSTGTDYFNLKWIKEKISINNESIATADVQATLTELTVDIILDAIKEYPKESEIAFCGGGIKNNFLMSRIKHKLNKKINLTFQLYGVGKVFTVHQKLTLNKKFALESVNEAKVKRPVNRWLELKNDETMHPHKKMAMGLKELKYQLRETEKFFNWYNKIKTMNELDSNQYWKRTNKHIYKIKERLVNIAKTIQEIEK